NHANIFEYFFQKNDFSFRFSFRIYLLNSVFKIIPHRSYEQQHIIHQMIASKTSIINRTN
ncbi:hypothetical protein, partial [Duncaniella muris]|uniref:hypothetical protein n=1 Tax=Duncaniella muris TaxID=2094150 RepID=UPI0025A6813E